MSKLSKQNLKSLGFIYKAFFVDDIKNAFIKPVVDAAKPGSTIPREQIMNMRNAYSNPTSIFKNRPSLGQANGFAAQAVENISRVNPTYNFSKDTFINKNIEKSEPPNTRVASSIFSKKSSEEEDQKDNTPNTTNSHRATATSLDTIAMRNATMKKRGVTTLVDGDNVYKLKANVIQEKSKNINVVSDPVFKKRSNMNLRSAFAAKSLAKPVENGPNNHDNSNEKDIIRLDLQKQAPRVLCLDIGTRLIGVSISSSDLNFAIPLMTMNLTEEIVELDELEELIDNPHLMKQVMTDADHRVYRKLSLSEIAQMLNNLRLKYNAVCCVVGLPSKFDENGEVDEGDKTYRFVKKFVKDMQLLNGLGKGAEVVFWNEYGSSSRALNMMRARGLKVDFKTDFNKLVRDYKNGKRIVDESYVARKENQLDMYASTAILDSFLHNLGKHGEEQYSIIVDNEDEFEDLDRKPVTEASGFKYVF